MNIVIYAGDRKYYSVLEPISKELKNTNHSFLFYYTKSTQLLYPSHPDHKQYFEYDGQINEENPVVSETLQLQIPFKPDVLILARERWQPEQSIIHEFKTKWGCKVCCVEVSSHLTNNIENRLEMLSRTQYPQNLVDYFFEHSKWAKQRRIDCLDESYKDKTIVVGNTRNFKATEIESIKEKYKIDPSKKQILFWGVINTTRKSSFEVLKVLRSKTKETHQIFYKCYPGEPFNEHFQKDFSPFCVEGVEVIYDENDKLIAAEKNGRKVTLNKPFRTPDGPKKSSVYVKNDKGNVVKVNFGDPDMKIKKNIPERRRSFRARHNCENPGPKWKARYWSCKAW
jgi:hypothetical protein